MKPSDISIEKLIRHRVFKTHNFCNVFAGKHYTILVCKTCNVYCSVNYNDKWSYGVSHYYTRFALDEWEFPRVEAPIDLDIEACTCDNLSIRDIII